VAWTVVGLLLANVRVGAGVLLVGAAYMGVQTLIDGDCSGPRLRVVIG
jgi:hypothetical protein